MIPSVSIFRFAAALAFAFAFAPSVRAQDATQVELKTLRQLVEQQSKQLDALTVQVAKIQARLDAGGEAAAPVAGTGASAQAAEVATAPAPAPATPPKPANVHIVVKGESLDKIAHMHNTTSAEIQKINHISQPKKLQIGQQLILPPTPKKEAQ